MCRSPAHEQSGQEAPAPSNSWEACSPSGSTCSWQGLTTPNPNLSKKAIQDVEGGDTKLLDEFKFNESLNTPASGELGKWLEANFTTPPSRVSLKRVTTPSNMLTGSPSTPPSLAHVFATLNEGPLLSTGMLEAVLANSDIAQHANAQLEQNLPSTQQHKQAARQLRFDSSLDELAEPCSELATQEPAEAFRKVQAVHCAAEAQRKLQFQKTTTCEGVQPGSPTIKAIKVVASSENGLAVQSTATKVVTFSEIEPCEDQTPFVLPEKAHYTPEKLDSKYDKPQKKSGVLHKLKAGVRKLFKCQCLKPNVKD